MDVPGVSARTQAERLQFEPGKGWSYSNIGHMLVRRLIERVTQRSFAEVMAEEVCRPLGLLQTDVVTDRAALHGLVAGYSVALADGGYAVDVRERYDPGWVATGVMASTASEVVRFYQGLFAGDLLPATLLADMCAVIRTMTTHPHFVTPSYGLGLMADPDSPSGALFGHNGGGPGYTASSFHFLLPQGEPVTVAVLANFEAPDAVQRMAFVVREVVGPGSGT